jgi:hypothetical protein
MRFRFDANLTGEDLVRAKEKVIEGHILQYLAFKKIFCWKVNSVGIWDEKKGLYRKARSKFIINGVSDILGIVNDGTGRMIAIECKTPERKKSGLTDDQKIFLKHITDNGGIAFVASSIKDVQDKLKELGILKD